MRTLDASTSQLIFNPALAALTAAVDLEKEKEAKKKRLEASFDYALESQVRANEKKKVDHEAKVPTPVPEFDMEDFQGNTGIGGPWLKDWPNGTNPVFTPKAEKENFFKENKKTLVILGAVMVVAIVGLFIYSRTKS